MINGIRDVEGNLQTSPTATVRTFKRRALHNWSQHLLATKCNQT